MTLQLMCPQLLGWMPRTPSNGTATFALDQADGGELHAYAFIAPASLPLNKVRAYVSAIAGTKANISVTCKLTADVNGYPPTDGSSLDGPRTVGNLAAGWWEWTDFTYTLTAGTRYWLVFKNTSAAPNTDYPTFRYGVNETWAMPYLGTRGEWSLARGASTTDGATWGTNTIGICGFRCELNDSGTPRYFGTPIQSLGLVASSVGVYATREVGVKFTTPANCRVNVRGMCMFTTKVGTPDDLELRLYTGNTLTAEAAVIPASKIGGSAYYSAMFAAAVTLQPATAYRAVIGNSGAGGDTSNYYRTVSYTIENDANSKALFPWGSRRCYFDGSSWDDTVDTEIVPWGLILDSEGEFATAGSGLTRNRGILTGGAL